MALFDTLKEAFRQNPPELEKPHFYKASSETSNRLEFLREYWWTASDADRPQLERDIVMLLDRIEGEKCIEAELMASDLPIVVLRDLHLTAGDLSTQIDFLIITAKFIMIVECKDLIGHLDITSDGRFNRTYVFEGQTSQAEIISPLARNADSFEVIRRLRVSSQRSELAKAILERTFDQNYRSVAVLANPKTTVDLRQADLAIKSQIIYCSQIADYIKDLLDTLKRDAMPEKQMYELAYYFMRCHQQT